MAVFTEDTSLEAQVAADFARLFGHMHNGRDLFAGWEHWGRQGRASVMEQVDRLVRGVPLVRFDRKLSIQWTYVCPLPECGALYDGFESTMECQVAWYLHAALKHPDFKAAWPDDISVEGPRPAPAPRKPAKPKAPKTPGMLWVRRQPETNEKWGNLAKAYEDGGELTWIPGHGSAILTLPDYGFARNFADFLVKFYGIQPEDVWAYEHGKQPWDLGRVNGHPQPHSEPVKRPGPALSSARINNVSKEAYAILGSWKPGDSRAELAWAAGAATARHAMYFTRKEADGLRRFLDEKSIGPESYGSSLKGGRQFTARRGYFEITKSGYADEARTKYVTTVIVKMKWKDVAALVNGADIPAAVWEDITLTMKDRYDHTSCCCMNHFKYGTPENLAAHDIWWSIENRCRALAAQVWHLCRPV